MATIDAANVSRSMLSTSAEGGQTVAGPAAFRSQRRGLDDMTQGVALPGTDTPVRATAVSRW